MDDDANDTGLGGLAWYQLGRMSAESDRVRSDAVDAVLSRRRPQTNVQDLVVQNQALVAENARLRQQLLTAEQDLVDYEANYRNLKAWANRAEAQINQLLKERQQ